jgi:SPP1 family phage portal protein
MTIDELKQQVTTDYSALVESIITDKKNADVIATAIDQYDPSEHDIFDETERPDKQYKDEKGNTLISKVSRLSVPFQKQIVSRAATFLCGNPIELITPPIDDADPKKQTLLNAVKKIWEDNKLDYKSKQIAKLVFSETEAAELWYVEQITDDEAGYWDGILSANAKFKLRMKILANSLGDKLYPVYSPTGDMIAFGRGYSIKDEEHFDIYTADTVYESVKKDNTWVNTPKPNIYKKIPVIYYSQAAPEWNDVQVLIDQYEKRLSNQSDVNDYFGSPLLVVVGKILGLSKKGESGKVLELEPGASVNYATWNQAPESVKNELETVERLIFQMTDTPNISFEQMKGLGVFSGIALKMLFMAAHMKASDKEETFGESIQRRINYLKAIVKMIDVSLGKTTLSISPKFEYYLPKDFEGLINTLVSGVQGKIMSQETAVKLNPFVEDPTKELEMIKSEQSGADALSNLLNS